MSLAAEVEEWLRMHLKTEPEVPKKYTSSLIPGDRVYVMREGRPRPADGDEDGIWIGVERLIVNQQVPVLKYRVVFADRSSATVEHDQEWWVAP